MIQSHPEAKYQLISWVISTSQQQQQQQQQRNVGKEWLVDASYLWFI